MVRYSIELALGTLTLVAMGAALALAIALTLPGGRTWLSTTLGGNERHVIGWAWVVSLIAMIGSLYFSDVRGLPPCLLCWYQRIAMYPLVLVLGVGLFRADSQVWRFALPLPIVGAAISVYHVALQYQPSLQVVECTTGVPCTARLLVVYGFVSIPVMASAAFLLITTLLLTMRVTRAGSAAGSEAGGGLPIE